MRSPRNPSSNPVIIGILSTLLFSLGGNAHAQEAKTDQDTKSASTPKQWMDILSEDEFKALHELKEGETPPLHGKMISLEGGSKAYLSLPKDAVEGEPLPGVIVIHEWWGLNNNIKHWSDRMASAGYAALAVDLYSGKVANNPDDAMKFMNAVDQKAALETLTSAHQFLLDDERVQAQATASIGWCFGGGWSLQCALNLPELDLAVIYYGRLVTDVEALKAIKSRVIGVFGDEDRGIPPETVNEFEKSLESADVEATIYRYPANHAFANPSSARYDQKSATDAWNKVRAALKEVFEG